MTLPFSTLPGLALYAGSMHRNPAALGYKEDGRWRAISSSEFLESVRRAGEALIELGLRPGDRVGIAADSSPFWLMADMAALGAGAVTVPLFPNAAQDGIRHQIADSGMRFLFTGTPELYETLRPLCGSVEHVLVLSSRSVFVQPPGSPSTDGPVAGDSGVPEGEWDRRARAVRPGDVATIIYTSGSTGDPKGVALTHANVVSQVHAAFRRFPLNPQRDSALSFLPLAHIFERMVSCFYIASGVSLRFAEEPARVPQNLRELHPTLLTVVPRFLEKAHDRILETARERGGLPGKLALAAIRRAFARIDNSRTDWKDRLFERMVYRRLRDRMGGRLRLVICGSAPLDARLCRFFMNVGIQVYEGYGLTESAPVLTVNYPGHRKPGTVGRAYPGVELRIAPDAEVLARGPNIMQGYYGLPEATAEVLDADGWLHTGDLGRLDGDGYLTVTGRKKELFKTANGKYVAPIPIEHAAAAADKLVEAAVIVAEGRPYVTAVLYPNFEALLAWRAELEAAGTLPEQGDASFLRAPIVLERYAAIVESLNGQLNSWERIQRFCLADAPPSIESGELTPTLKIRRHAVVERYTAKIEAMYGKNGTAGA